MENVSKSGGGGGGNSNALNGHNISLYIVTIQVVSQCLFMQMLSICYPAGI